MHFNKEEIIKARTLLREQFGDTLAGTPIMDTENRRGSQGRSAMHANALDVVNAMNELLRVDYSTKFAILDINLLPVVRPRSGEHDIDERVVTLENALRRLQERMDQQEDSMSMLAANKQDEFMKKQIEEIQDAVKSYETVVNETRMSYAAKAATKPILQHGKQPTANLVKNVEPSTSSATKPGNNEWQEVAKKKRKPTKVLHGSAKDTNIKAGNTPTPDRDFWISNIDLTMSDESLKEFIQNGGSKEDGQVKLRLFEPRYKDDFTTKCFRITIGVEDYKKVYNPEFWPEDIRIRKYWIKSDKAKQEDNVTKDSTKVNNDQQEVQYIKL